VTSSAAERPLISPVLREIWRPFYAGGVMVCAVVIAASATAVRGSAVAVDVALFVIVVIVATTGARTALWRMGPGRVTVTYDDTGLFVRQGAKLLRHYPWQDVEQVDVLAGYRRPEWSRAALFAFLRVMWRDDRADVDISPEFLIVRRPLVDEAQRELQAVASRYLGTTSSA
jgi:hypothetical protein